MWEWRSKYLFVWAFLNFIDFSCSESGRLNHQTVSGLWAEQQRWSSRRVCGARSSVFCLHPWFLRLVPTLQLTFSFSFYLLTKDFDLEILFFFFSRNSLFVPFWDEAAFDSQIRSADAFDSLLKVRWTPWLILSRTQTHCEAGTVTQTHLWALLEDQSSGRMCGDVCMWREVDGIRGGSPQHTTNLKHGKRKKNTNSKMFLFTVNEGKQAHPSSKL